MTPPPIAKLAFITEPEPGIYNLNLSFDAGQDRIIDVMSDGERHERVQITAAQLRQIILKATPMVLR